MATKKATPKPIIPKTTAIVKWDEELARQAEVAAGMEAVLQYEVWCALLARCSPAWKSDGRCHP